MFSRKKIVGNFVGLGFLLSISSGVAVAQMPVEMATSAHNGQFRRIEQPLVLRVGVTIGGIALIGLELWWFLFSKTKAQQAETQQGVQEMTRL